MTIFNDAVQDEQSLLLHTKVNRNERRRVLDQAIKNGQAAKLCPFSGYSGSLYIERC
jgi:hypothetical protein